MNKLTPFVLFTTILLSGCLMNIQVVKKDKAPYINFDTGAMVTLTVNDSDEIIDTAFLHKKITQKLYSGYRSKPFQIMIRQNPDCLVNVDFKQISWTITEEDRTQLKRSEEYEVWNSGKDEKTDPETVTTEYIVAVFAILYEGTINLEDLHGGSYSTTFNNQYTTEYVMTHFRKNRKTGIASNVLQGILDALLVPISYFSVKGSLDDNRIDQKILAGCYNHMASNIGTRISSYFPMFITEGIQLMSVNNEIDEQVKNINYNLGIQSMMRYLENYLKILKDDEQARAYFNMSILNKVTGGYTEADRYYELYSQSVSSAKTRKEEKIILGR